MIYAQTKDYTLYEGKMQDELLNLPDNSIDSIVCDPPYELNFMGKGWDNTGVAFQKETWEHCFRVLKNGGYLLAFGGSRTFHRIAVAIEDAGFEIRDTIMWLYGSGFPKSMNIGLAIDKREGLQGQRGIGGFNVSGLQEQQNRNATLYKGSATDGSKQDAYTDYKSDLAKQWAGWGTCLKPAYEPIIVARKPVEGTIVDNVLKYGTGGINIDECRVGTETIKGGTMPKMGAGDKGVCNYQTIGAERIERDDTIGRFPANVIHDGSQEVIEGMPDTKGSDNIRHNNNQSNNHNVYSNYNDCNSFGYDDEGSASRYFYCAKASKKDRDEGLDEFEEKTAGERTNRKDGSAGINAYAGERVSARNFHPTIKPVELMQYLVRLVTRKGGTILDCFMGSGSTGKAVMFENRERDARYKFIGVEMTHEYLPICQARIEYALHKFEYELAESAKRYDTDTTEQLNMFNMI